MSKLPLLNEYVIFTGITRTDEPIELTEKLGGIPIVAPFITTKEIVEESDLDRLRNGNAWDWFIFTSQSSVQAFIHKMERFRMSPSDFQVKFAAVGEKTKAALEKKGFTVHFTPSTYSADVFVQEFSEIAPTTAKCLFLRGNLAKQTISQGLPQYVEEWTVYETISVKENVHRVRELLESGKSCSLLFTSPSTARVFHETIGKEINYTLFTVCAIGHVTRDYLVTLGISVQVMPDTYTISELLNKLAEWKGRE